MIQSTIRPNILIHLLYISALFVLIPERSTSQSTGPRTEFRGVWIASVDNIDWPSKKGLPADSQRAEFIRLLDKHAACGMNAVVVQIRPATDAFYPSPYEPWSEWLTGRQGLPPSPYYDPLAFMITETHNRGMEFHAWCNPYRATFSIGKSSIASNHITRLHPEWFLNYGGTRYFDPGNRLAQEFVTRVIRDIVTRYDIDAIHFDDYFYPYRIAGKEFPDQESYRKSGTTLSLEDWRRSNVDSIIISLSRAIKEIKPYCRFGISPFGVWRNIDKDQEGSATKAGQTNYDDLYANILLWLKNGWIDYVVPQLYWEFGHRAAPYEVLLDWWDKHSYGKPCYVGLGIFKAGTNTIWKDPTLLPRQVVAQRNESNVQGSVYFSGSNFFKNINGWADSLALNYYRQPALIPPAAGLQVPRPSQPAFSITGNEESSGKIIRTLEIKTTAENELVKTYVISRLGMEPSASDAGQIIKIIPVGQRAQVLWEIPAQDKGKYRYYLTAVNRYNLESLPVDLDSQAGGFKVDR
jgi:uncharacterized lipoprotein YddW (UPF0748 family)